MSKQDWAKNNVNKLFKLPKIESVLDVGCGLSLKSKFIPAKIRVGVDIYEEYFNHIESKVPYVVIKGDVTKLKDMFVPKSFDLVILMDIVEHVEKGQALEMIAECEKIARKAVVIETPRGFVPQNIDILGYGGHEFQTHRCGWEVEEFEKMGYQVLVRDYEMQNVKRHTDIDVGTSIQIIDAIKYL